MKAKRNTGVDITRIIAFFCVVSIHFFWNSGFYERPVDCTRMYLMNFIRTPSMACVPLFLIITGYLMSERKVKPDKESLLMFYSRLSRVLILYVLSELTVILVLAAYENQQITIKDVVLELLSFSNGYAWYVEMYIGLFLMIPFLNLIWQKCEGREQRKAVVAVFLLLTASSSIVNIFDFSSVGTFIYPWTSESITKLLPAWWDNLYPVSYYFIGAYLKKDVDAGRMKSSKLLAALLLVIIIFSVFNVWKSYSVKFVWGKWQDRGGIENVIVSVLIFLLINSFNYEKVPETIKSGLGKIAGLTFSAYLLSMIPDTILYEKLAEAVPKITMRMSWFPVMVITVIIISLLLAAVIQLLYNMIIKVYRAAGKKSSA